MKRLELNRRDFNKLTMAAFGGLMAGSMIGCGNGDDDETADDDNGDSDEHGDHDHDEEGSDTSDTELTQEERDEILLAEKHVCRGLNSCMNKGASGENACAGQGTCATAKAHSCHKENECKGEGGCGDYPGQNACKGQGACEVPLSEGAWTKARAAFDKAYEAKNNKAPGEAPEAG